MGLKFEGCGEVCLVTIDDSVPWHYAPCGWKKECRLHRQQSGDGLRKVNIEVEIENRPHLWC